MTNTDNTPTSTAEDTFEALGEIPAQEPSQSGEYPKWEYKPRQNPRWGTVEREGLIVGRGPTRKVIPPDDVYKLAALGCTIEEISDFFSINRETLKYNFSDYITKGRAEMKQRLRQAMFHNACNNHNAAVQIFLAKNILGMSDTPVNSEDSQPLPWTEVVDTDASN